MEDGLWHYLPTADDALVACGRNKYAVSTAMPLMKHIVTCPDCLEAM
jgi:hypothetical protein